MYVLCVCFAITYVYIIFINLSYQQYSFSQVKILFPNYVADLQKTSEVDIIRNETLKQSQCFSNQKLSMLSERLSYMYMWVNVTGIYLSCELMAGPRQVPKHPCVGLEVQIQLQKENSWDLGNSVPLNWICPIFIFIFIYLVSYYIP